MKNRNNMILVCLLASALAFAGCSDDDPATTTTATEAGDEAGDEAAAGDTVSYSGVLGQWVDPEGSLVFEICEYETENCTTSTEEGTFTLEGLPASSEVLLTFVGGDDARLAFPIVTGEEDIEGPRIFTVVDRATADLMLQVAGEPEGVDDTKSVLTFYAGVAGYPTARGLAGVEVTYDGPDTEKGARFIIPIGADPGVFVAAEDVTTTSTTGNGFVPNIEPGDYTITFGNDRTCTAQFAWPGEEGSAANTFRTKLIEGFATFSFVECATDATISANGVVNEPNLDPTVPSAGLEGFEVCLLWGTDENGEYAESNCGTTDAEGAVVHADLPGDTQFLVRGSKEGYISTLGTLEGLIEDFDWAGLSGDPALLDVQAALTGVTADDTKGHLSVVILNADGDSLDGFAVSLLDADGESTEAAYFEGLEYTEGATATSASGVAGFFNVDPGTYTLVVDKTDVLCTPSPWSWAISGGYAAPVEANALTQIGVICVDEPAPLFGEPETPVDAPACGDDAATNCTEACRFWVDCGFALCEGFQDGNEWETGTVYPQSQAACEAICEEAVVATVCLLETCNDVLTLTTETLPSFANSCENGLPTILETAVTNAANEDSVISTVVGLIESSEASIAALSGDGPFTVFLPVNDSFEGIDLGAIDAETLDSILALHAVDGGFLAADVVALLADGPVTVDTLGGAVILEQKEEGDILIGGATIINTDFFASNGVIHYIQGIIQAVETTEEETTEEETTEEETTEEETTEEETTEEETTEGETTEETTDEETTEDPTDEESTEEETTDEEATEEETTEEEDNSNG